MEAQAKPDLLEQIDADEKAFFESIGANMPEGEQLSDVDARIDWLLEQIAERQDQIEHVKAVARRRIDMIRSWQEDETAKVGREIEWLEGQIRLNAPKTVDDLQALYGTRKKSISLPSGTVGFRSSADTVEVEDEEKALAWAETACPDAIKVKRSVLKTPIKALLAEGGVLTTGEKCDPDENGLRFVPGEESFYVKAGG